MLKQRTEGSPQPALSLFDAMAIIVGLVIGAGIFRFPSLVAGSSANEWVFYCLWIAGGLISIVGALCYAELASAYPNAGGDYHFLQRAFGRSVSFLFAWARIAVITTGSIAVLGYTFGDYASNLYNLGASSSAIYAGLAVLGLTAINILGMPTTRGTQNLLTTLEVLGLLAVAVTGLVLVMPAVAPAAAAAAGPASGLDLSGVPLAILLVLFTYGGWNESAYISAEMKDKRNIMRALVLSLVIITALYLLLNYAYVRTLGLAGLAASKTVAADVLGAYFGDIGAKLISLLIAVSALTSINATIVVGARSNYALGRDWRAFRWLGRWDGATDAPRNALYMQGAVSLALVVAAAYGGEIEALVSYTMPVFWLFVLLVGIGIFVLRRKDPDTPRPFKVPLYPFTPLIFVATCAYLLYSSLAYVGVEAYVGLIILGIGALLLALDRYMTRNG
jgi:basic amino acid/polyamine antiporter, APA family